MAGCGQLDAAIDQYRQALKIKPDFADAQNNLGAAIGAAVGPGSLLSILAWMALAGGILALVAAARGKRVFAYVPAIAAGVVVETFWPGGLARVLLR